ncbi:MAG: S8 family peptidase [bacterium]|nr:S8 family peptidase [bacterium]
MKRVAILAAACGAMLLCATQVVPSRSPSGSADQLHVIVQGPDLRELIDVVRDSGAGITHRLGIIDAVAVQATPGQLSELERSVAISRIVENRPVELTAGTRSEAPRQGAAALNRLGKRGTVRRGPRDQSGDFDEEVWRWWDNPDDEDDESGGSENNGDEVSSDEEAPETYFNIQIVADLLHRQGLTGDGVTLAILDTGLWGNEAAPGIVENAFGEDRILAQYDAVLNQLNPPGTTHNDANGHGTHVASVAASSDRSGAGRYAGVAPNADLISVRAFRADGKGCYADIIRGLDWVLQNKQVFDIRVVNLSFSATPHTFYWEDPLNQAVMRLWAEGVVVVAAAGNTGPDPMSIGLPGNVPYVITVGAASDNYTQTVADDFVASFSASGPTLEGFLKPELIAPGGHVRGLMPPDSKTVEDYPAFVDANDYFTMSGTSQSAAIVSGVVALMLEADPGLMPNDVKCRVMTSARPAVNQGGNLIYSPFQQGRGLVNAYSAVMSNQWGCANVGLDIDKDLQDLEHFGGPAWKSEDGEYYIMTGGGFESEGGVYAWDGIYSQSPLTAWIVGFPWLEETVDLRPWEEDYPWLENTDFPPTDPDQCAGPTSSDVAINVWVEQE